VLKDVLRKTKGLASVRCGEDVVRLTETRGKYAEAARAIESLDPETVELLDGDGAVLKVIRLREEEDDESGSEEDNIGGLAKLAKVLGDVSDKAAARHEAAYRMAFDRQNELVRLIADRLNSLERAWQRVIALEYRRAAESASGDGDDMDSTMSSVLKLAAAKAIGGNGGNGAAKDKEGE